MKIPIIYLILTKKHLKMKNLIFATVVATLVFSCNDQKNKEFVTVAGKIENIETDSVFIYKDNFKKGFAVNENGEFSDTLKLIEPSYFYFLSERERTEIFLSPGDSLYISTSMQDFDNDLTYFGTIEAENNFITKKQLQETEIIMSDPMGFFSVDKDKFKKNVEKIKSDLLTELDEIKVSTDFKQMESRHIEYNYYLMLSQYDIANAFYNQSSQPQTNSFNEELSDIDLENEKDFQNISSYRNLVVSLITQKVEKTDDFNEIKNIIGSVKSTIIKDKLMRDIMYYKIMSSDPNAEQLNAFIQKHSTDEKLKLDAQETFDKVKNLLPGNPSPKFNYPDINGKYISLDDLKGKLVYIDVWATWCAPCLAEVPHLKQLTEDYKNQELTIVSISIDPQSDYEKWKKMVENKDLKGVQIFSDNDWNSQFVVDYGIRGIPRFILLDKEGKIISADAPRPSNPKLRSLIDENI